MLCSHGWGGVLINSCLQIPSKAWPARMLLVLTPLAFICPRCLQCNPAEVRMLRDEDNLGRGATRANWVLLRTVLRIYKVHRQIHATAFAAFVAVEEERGVSGLEQLTMAMPSAELAAVRRAGQSGCRWRASWGLIG